MTDQSMDDIVYDVEKQLIAIIMQNLERQSMTEEQTKKMAADFLALLPIHDKHELLEKLGGFSKAYRDTKGIYVKYAAPLEEEERQRKLTEMSEHIKNGQIEHALAVAKGGAQNGGS